MTYTSVNNRCLVNFDRLNLPITEEEGLRVLYSKGFVSQDIDIISIARSLVGQAVYRRGARMVEAPAVFDCSSFIKWLYGQKGLYLPRRSIQQRKVGESVPVKNLSDGDVIFVSGYIDYFDSDPADGVGHVGIYTGEGTVIHAANRRLGVVETKFERFIGTNKFRDIRRYVPKEYKHHTLICPKEMEIESSDDIRWVILQNLPK